MVSPALQALTTAAKRLPDQLATAAMYVVEHPFNAATQSMRRLAAQSGQTPSTFTRMARAVGYSGWEELRTILAEEARSGFLDSVDGPYSTAANRFESRTDLVGQMLASDVKALETLDGSHLDAAAELLEAAADVVIIGFRSNFAAAHLFHYLYRLFRPDVTLIDVRGGALDLELARIRKSSAAVLFSFEPYSKDSVLVAREIARSNCQLLAIVDSNKCEIAKYASKTLLFDCPSTSYFPSLTACFSLAQVFAAVLYERAGSSGRAQLKQTEARMAEYSTYVPSK